MRKKDRLFNPASRVGFEEQGLIDHSRSIRTIGDVPTFRGQLLAG